MTDSPDRNCDSGSEADPLRAIREKLLREAIALEHAEYSDLWDAWKNLEFKAQVFLGINGLLAAALADLAYSGRGSLSLASRVGLFLCAALVMSSFWCAAMTLKVRRVRLPELGALASEPLIHLATHDAVSDVLARNVDFLRIRADRWRRANEALRLGNRDKASGLYASTALLGWATSLFVITIFLVLFF